MNVYTYVGFKGLAPVGTSAVVVAPTRKLALSILSQHLNENGLPQEEPLDDKNLKRVDTSGLGVEILTNGDY